MISARTITRWFGLPVAVIHSSMGTVFWSFYEKFERHINWSIKLLSIWWKSPTWLIFWAGSFIFWIVASPSSCRGISTSGRVATPGAAVWRFPPTAPAIRGSSRWKSSSRWHAGTGTVVIIHPYSLISTQQWRYKMADAANVSSILRKMFKNALAVLTNKIYI